MPDTGRPTRGPWPLLVLAGLFIVAAVLVPPVPQPAAYHDFADQRTVLGIVNFGDVATNAAFLLTGIFGLLVVGVRRGHFARTFETVPYFIFFLGVSLTALGSAYYHLAPDNERLFWDRLPMTFAFMSLIAAQLNERVGGRFISILLAPLLAVGVATVIYWIATERGGAGNVMPYVALQAVAVGGLLLLAGGYPSRYTRGRDIFWVFAAYLLAKLLEFFDHQVLALGQVLSGHSLKHLVAAIAGLLVCRMLWLREPRPGVRWR